MKQKFTLFIGVETSAYQEGNIVLRDYDASVFSSSTIAPLCQQEVELDIPEFSLVEKKIQILEQVLEAEINEADKRQANLRMQLNELKCISHEV